MRHARKAQSLLLIDRTQRIGTATLFLLYFSVFTVYKGGWLYLLPVFSCLRSRIYLLKHSREIWNER